MNVFLQHFTCFSQVFVNLGRVKISQIRPKLDIHKRIEQYLLSDSCSNKESDTREFGLSHSCAASQLAVGFGWSVPLRGTYGEMGGLLCPTAALLRSLQWVSDSRSRVAEHRGDGRFAYTHSCAASQLAVGFGWSVPLCGTCGETGGLLCPTAALLRSLQWVSDGRFRVAEPMGRWEVCYTPQRRCFAACSGFRIVGPASRNIGGAMGDGCVMCEMHCAMCRCAMACVRCAVSWRDTSI